MPNAKEFVQHDLGHRAAQDYGQAAASSSKVQNTHVGTIRNINQVWVFNDQSGHNRVVAVLSREMQKSHTIVASDFSRVRFESEQSGHNRVTLMLGRDLQSTFAIIVVCCVDQIRALGKELVHDVVVARSYCRVEQSLLGTDLVGTRHQHPNDLFVAVFDREVQGRPLLMIQFGHQRGLCCEQLLHDGDMSFDGSKVQATQKTLVALFTNHFVMAVFDCEVQSSSASVIDRVSLRFEFILRDLSEELGNHLGISVFGCSKQGNHAHLKQTMHSSERKKKIRVRRRRHSLHTNKNKTKNTKNKHKISIEGEEEEDDDEAVSCPGLEQGDTALHRIPPRSARPTC